MARFLLSVSIALSAALRFMIAAVVVVFVLSLLHLTAWRTFGFPVVLLVVLWIVAGVLLQIAKRAVLTAANQDRARLGLEPLARFDDIVDDL